MVEAFQGFLRVFYQKRFTNSGREHGERQGRNMWDLSHSYVSAAAMELLKKRHRSLCVQEAVECVPSRLAHEDVVRFMIREDIEQDFC